MKIILRKINQSNHSLRVARNGEILDEVSLDTKTYFLHDVVHYCVEKELSFKNGFWGMIAQGYKLAQLSGKDNELTEELRHVEKIVGSIQSVYSGHMPITMYEEHMLRAQLQLSSDFVMNVTNKIAAIMNKWKYLPLGQSLELEFIV